MDEPYCYCKYCDEEIDHEDDAVYEYDHTFCSARCADAWDARR